MLGIADYGTYCASFVVFLALAGPGTLALLSSAAQGGFRAGIAATWGIIFGDQVWLWLAAAGVAALMVAHPAIFEVLKWAGTAYLAWLGIKLLLSRGRVSEAVRIQPRAYLYQTLLITLLNPKAIVFYLAFIPLFIDPAQQQGAITFAAMAATNMVLTLAYCCTLCGAALWLGMRLRASLTLGSWLRKVAGLLLVGFAVKLAA